jgi:hypothetical protein
MTFSKTVQWFDSPGPSGTTLNRRDYNLQVKNNQLTDLSLYTSPTPEESFPTAGAIPPHRRRNPLPSEQSLPTAGDLSPNPRALKFLLVDLT